MAIEVDCECGRHFGVSDALAGRTVACPACGLVVPVQPSTFRPATLKAGRRETSGLGVSGVVIGLVLLVCCSMPGLKTLVILGAVFGGILSLVGLLVALTGQRSGPGWPIAGMILNLFAYFGMALTLASVLADRDVPGDPLPLKTIPVPLDSPQSLPEPPEPLLIRHDEPTEVNQPDPIPLPPGADAPPGDPFGFRGKSLYDAMVEDGAVEARVPSPFALKGESLLDSMNAEDEAKRKAESDASSARAATILKMGLNLEKSGKSAPALENYRRIVS